MSEPLEDVVARELPPWMRAEASVSVSRSADSTGAAQFPGQPGTQQASSTEQESLQVSLRALGLPSIRPQCSVQSAPEPVNASGIAIMGEGWTL